MSNKWDSPRRRSSFGRPLEANWKEFLPSGELPLIVDKLLFLRGYIDPTLRKKHFDINLSHLADPFSIVDMTKAVERLSLAWSRQEKVVIYGDFDLDGTSGVALLYDGLTQLGFAQLQVVQPLRLKDGYGFHTHLVEELASVGVGLILTVDVGITSFEACVRAKELNIDVIVTDHHAPLENLPEAYCVVNPNRKDCTSGLGYLAGAGVAFYLIRALSSYLLQKEKITKEQIQLKSLLDCFCIATITDMVPMVGDNRVLVRQGLRELAQTKRPGLRALLAELGLLDRDLSSHDVGIRFAPKLNALSRMEGAVLPRDLYLTTDDIASRGLAKAAMTQHKERVQLQDWAEGLASDLLQSWEHEEFVFVFSEEFHKGVIGLIATKLSKVYDCPIFVGCKDKVTSRITGSCRLPDGGKANLVEALDSAKEFLLRYGGHESAAGFELEEKNAEGFLWALKKYFQKIPMQKKEESSFYDLELEASDLQMNLVKWIESMGPFGVQFPAPKFLFKNITIFRVQELKGGHIKLFANQGKIEILAFSPKDPKYLKSLMGQEVQLIGDLQRNHFGGQMRIQILLEDIQAQSEIVSDSQISDYHENNEPKKHNEEPVSEL